MRKAIKIGFIGVFCAVIGLAFPIFNMKACFCIQQVSSAVIEESHIHKRKQLHVGRLDAKHHRVHFL